MGELFDLGACSRVDASLASVSAAVVFSPLLIDSAPTDSSLGPATTQEVQPTLQARSSRTINMLLAARAVGRPVAVRWPLSRNCGFFFRNVGDCSGCFARRLCWWPLEQLC